MNFKKHFLAVTTEKKIACLTEIRKNQILFISFFFKISFHFISTISGYDALRTFFFFLTYFWL